MNGVAGPLDAADAWDIAMMLVKAGRAVDPREWVDEMVAAREASAALGFAGGF